MLATRQSEIDRAALDVGDQSVRQPGADRTDEGDPP
jgi:hypothetical protein